MDVEKQNKLFCWKNVSVLKVEIKKKQLFYTSQNNFTQKTA